MLWSFQGFCLPIRFRVKRIDEWLCFNHVQLHQSLRQIPTGIVCQWMPRRKGGACMPSQCPAVTKSFKFMSWPNEPVPCLCCLRYLWCKCSRVSVFLIKEGTCKFLPPISCFKFVWIDWGTTGLDWSISFPGVSTGRLWRWINVHIVLGEFKIVE